MKTARKVFLALFIISTLGVFVLFMNFVRATSINPGPDTETPSSTKNPIVTENPDTVDPTASPENPETDPSSQNSSNVSCTALIGSILTSVTSLVGFVTTTVITLRKEKREASMADMERKKLVTELEKSKLELERLKKSRAKKIKK